jgi:hypothetical protein
MLAAPGKSPSVFYGIAKTFQFKPFNERRMTHLQPQKKILIRENILSKLAFRIKFSQVYNSSSETTATH